MQLDSGQAAFIALQKLRVFEGLRLAPYLCPAGKWTIGYGHVIQAGERHLMAGIDEPMAEKLLLNDLAWAMYAARDVGRVLTDWQAAALACLIFNIGLEAWKKSKIRRLVVAGKMQEAAAQFAAWSKINGVLNAGLLARRSVERSIFVGV